MRALALPLHTTVKGSGPVLVLIHGFLSSSRYFEHLESLLTDEYTVIKIDLLGFGSSKKGRIYSYEEHIEAIKQTLDALNITKDVTIVAHSMGSLLATRLACTYPKLIKSLFLFNPPIFANTEQVKEDLITTNSMYRFLLYSKLRSLGWFGLKLIPRPKHVIGNVSLKSDLFRHNGKARDLSLRFLIESAEFIPDLFKLKLPTQIVIGTYDRPIYHKNLAELKLPRNITIQTVETGHHTILRRPDIAKRLIRTNTLQ